jgi:hypothetical protein
LAVCALSQAEGALKVLCCDVECLPGTGALDFGAHVAVSADMGKPTILIGVPLHGIDLEMEPPAGRERLCAVWTRRPLGPVELQGFVSGGLAPSSPHQASRNKVRVKRSVQRLPGEDCQVVVVELDPGD